MTTALEGGEGSASCTARSLPPRKTPYPLYRRLDGPQGRSGQVWKISPPPGFDPRTVQPVASRYTDYANRPTQERVVGTNYYWVGKVQHFRCKSCIAKTQRRASILFYGITNRCDNVKWNLFLCKSTLVHTPIIRSTILTVSTAIGTIHALRNKICTSLGFSPYPC